MPKYLTPEALEEFKKELEYLKTVKRREMAERIKHAAAFGDLKENFAYHEAKEAQGFLEGRIQELRNIISSAKVIEKNKDGRIGVGFTVVIKSGDDIDEYKIVEPEEADIIKGKISAKSPLGKELIGKKKGEKIEIALADGKKEYVIVGVD